MSVLNTTGKREPTDLEKCIVCIDLIYELMEISKTMGLSNKNEEDLLDCNSRKNDIKSRGIYIYGSFVREMILNEITFDFGKNRVLKRLRKLHKNGELQVRFDDIDIMVHDTNREDLEKHLGRVLKIMERLSTEKGNEIKFSFMKDLYYEDIKGNGNDSDKYIMSNKSYMTRTVMNGVKVDLLISTDTFTDWLLNHPVDFSCNAFMLELKISRPLYINTFGKLKKVNYSFDDAMTDLFDGVVLLNELCLELISNTSEKMYNRITKMIMNVKPKKICVFDKLIFGRISFGRIYLKSIEIMTLDDIMENEEGNPYFSKENICAICMENASSLTVEERKERSMIKLPCDHIFCKKCFEGIGKRLDTLPNDDRIRYVRKLEDMRNNWKCSVCNFSDNRYCYCFFKEL
jgi:hypothetical protein